MSELPAEPVRSDGDLRAIMQLQRENLRSALALEEAASQGFVTVVHTLDILRRMHQVAPSVVVRDGDGLAGYALTMPLPCRDFLPVLAPMFEVMGGLSHQGRPLFSHRLYVMGQICVARAHRGRGVFQALYAGHARLHGPQHDLVVTEIASRNGRSLAAHRRVGFFELGRHRDATDDWVIVGWDFGQRGAR
jgi:hypothetical protein